MPPAVPFRDILLAEADRHGLALAASGPERFAETLLDTRDRRFRRAGTALVHRDFGDACEVAWLPRATRGAPLAPVSATSLALPHTAARLPDDCPEPLAASLRAIAGRRPIRPVLRLAVQREEFLVRRHGGWRGTIVVIEAIAEDLPDASSRLRVEWRVAVDRSGAPDPFFVRLAAAASLSPVETTASEEAWAASEENERPAGHATPAHPHLGITTGELAFAVMRRQLREIVRREPGTRLGADPEELHKMRVAVRRLRAALRLWRPCLGGAARELQRDWGVLGRALGATRDLDVEMEGTAAWIGARPAPDRLALAPFEAWLAGARAEARVAMLAALDDPAQDRLHRATTRWLRRGPPAAPAAMRPARRTAADFVCARRGRFLRAARRLRPGSPPEEWHRVRILAKHLRYCLEFHQVLLGPATREMIRGLVAVQDLLGEHQDLHVSLDRFRLLEEDPAVHLSARAIEILHERAEAARRRASELRAAFPETLGSVRGVAWKSLRAELGVGG
jgi:CHAD domain-containing protein